MARSNPKKPFASQGRRSRQAVAKRGRELIKKRQQEKSKQRLKQLRSPGQKTKRG